jgi:hypothetical protein
MCLNLEAGSAPTTARSIQEKACGILLLREVDLLVLDVLQFKSEFEGDLESE